MEKIRVIYRNNSEVEFNAPDGAYNDIVRLVMAEEPPEYISSLEGSIYKFCLSLKGVLFISLEKANETSENKPCFGFITKD